MKTIRKQTFETNSSSTHSFTVANNGQIHMDTFVKKYMNVEKFEAYVKQHYPNDNKVKMSVSDWIQLFCDCNDIGVECEYDG